MTVEQEIRDTDDQFAAAFNRGDIAALVAMHAEKALLLPPDSPMEKGGKAVEAGFTELLEAGWKNLKFTSVEIGSEGALAYHVGKYSADVPAKGGSHEKVTGKYVDIYKRDPDGAWKICVTMFNSDAPLPT